MQHTLTKPMAVGGPPPLMPLRAALLIRLVIGGVFVGDGLLKWLLPVTLGWGVSVPGNSCPGAHGALVGGRTCRGLLFLWDGAHDWPPFHFCSIWWWRSSRPLSPVVGTHACRRWSCPLGVPALLYDFRADVAQLLGHHSVVFAEQGRGRWMPHGRRRQGGGVQA